ncbi:hypothetical protein ACFL28_04010 [Candidatus Omnitrophota bacterium]
MQNKVKYYIDPNGEFVVENYNLAGTFSNFLPGIAGLFGIPMWAFYVNRAQCICSFGVKSKDSPIMEFLPANRAYQLVSSQGFRTFIKIKNNKKDVFHEPFRTDVGNSPISIDQKMFISSHELRLLESAPSVGIETGVSYFTVPNESFSALARVVTLKNISRGDLVIDILDGTPLMIPYGASNFFLQKMRRTIEAWMLVENLQRNAPFYRLKVDPRDISEVTVIKEGNFYLASSSKDGKDNTKLPVFIDPNLIFGQVKDFSYPVHFVNEPRFNVPPAQMDQNKLPCAMSFASFRLKKQETVTLCSLLGHISSKEKLNSLIPRLNKKEFFINKREENKNIIRGLQDDVFTASNEKRYDIYCAQTFLDNVLRGGYPIACNNDSHRIFYVYSRKHGDLERDYNRFYIQPTYFSQGNGNFRDINQNRRNDVFFNPDIKDSNILHFYNLQQADGFNPLVLHGIRFRLKDLGILKDVLRGKIEEGSMKKMEGLLSHSFAPGELFMNMEGLNIRLKSPWHEFLDDILKNCEAIYEAEHVEGFWIDHWTYNLDLIENFLAIYPERLKEILLDKKEFTFYDNIFHVKPRVDRCLLKGENKVRQYHALARDKKKEHLIKKRDSDPHTLRVRNGEGGVYKTTLLVKLLCLTVNKLSSLDPFGVGIEMEADKPGWCDSMNGLPGLFGSSTPEVFELKRQIVFILDSIKCLDLPDSCNIYVPEELYDFLRKIGALVKAQSKVPAKKREIYFWDKSNSVKERYRERIRFGFSGVEKSLSLAGLETILEDFLTKVEKAIKKTYILSKKTYPTYFINEVCQYKDTNRNDPIKGWALVKPTAFKNVRLPLFLEGVVRALKVEKDTKKARRLYQALKKTNIYDKKLKMYKISESLGNISKEVGRSSIFTPGWLENESVWLHMEYKYILEILRAGLYEEFFKELRNILIPFQKPEVYGRSVFENSSFIVSSAFPDKNLHGRGFVARLSGSTAEMLSIWLLMNVGEKPFFLNEEGELSLRFRPALPVWLFTKKAQNGFPKNTFAFKFLGKITVVYHNPRLKHTVGRDSVKTRFIVIRFNDGRKVEIKKDTITLPYSQDIRNRSVKRIDIYLR